MKSFVAFFALVAVAVADVSHLARNVGGEVDATIVQQDADVFPDQYNYAYRTSNGIAAQESGTLKQVGNDVAISAAGSNSYTSPEGQVVETQYIADENGYQPQGSHLPTPPPTQAIPDYILRSLQYIAAHPAKPEPQY